MPVLLKESVYDAWLHADTSVDDARELLKENRDKELISYRASRAVNTSKASGSELVKPLSE